VECCQLLTATQTAAKHTCTGDMKANDDTGASNRTLQQTALLCFHLNHSAKGGLQECHAKATVKLT